MTEDEWKLNIGQRVTVALPSNTLDSAMVLADSWLTANGGWDGGEGQPSGGESDDDVVAAIAADEIAKTNTVTITMPVLIKVSMVGNFASGTSTGDMVSAMQSAVEARLDAAFVGRDGAQLYEYLWGDETASVRAEGSLSSASMQAIQAAIEFDSTFVDPAAVATAAVRTLHSLPTTWICSSLYTRGNGSEPIVATVTKFVNTTYSSADDVGYHFVARIGRESGSVETVTRVDE